MSRPNLSSPTRLLTLARAKTAAPNPLFPDCANPTAIPTLLHVNAVLFILGTDAFNTVDVGNRSQSSLEGEGARVVFGVIEGKSLDPCGRNRGDDTAR